MKRLCFYPISAAEMIDAAREAERSCQSGQTLGLWRNACLLSRAVRDTRGKRVYRDGEAALNALTAETIACWTAAYAALIRPSEPDEESRLRWRVLKAFGVLPTERRAKRLTQDALEQCLLQMALDDQELLRDVCPTCRESLLTRKCPICGSVQFEENPNFDLARFEELKANGLSEKSAL